MPRPDDGDAEQGASRSPAPAPSGPQWTEEVIGGNPAPLSEADAKAIESLYQHFQTPAKVPPKRRKPK